MKYLNHTGTLFILLLSGWWDQSSRAQTEAVVKGEVVNESGLPVPNACIKPGIRDARTNASDQFILRNIAFPAHLTVSHMLYKDYLNTSIHHFYKQTLK